MVRIDPGAMGCEHAITTLEFGYVALFNDLLYSIFSPELEKNDGILNQLWDYRRGRTRRRAVREAQIR